MNLTDKTLAQYRILRKLGNGGMATVYLAKDEVGEHVALKVLHSTMSNRADIVKRFRREASVGERLLHPHIVRTYGLQRADGRLFIVMDYMAGGTLLEKIKKEKRLKWPEAVGILQQVGEALTYAHAQDVIHRDVKPSNILFDRAGVVHLADFGVARDLGLETMTATGTQPGTYHYMAPEQIKGERVDARADQFALATVFYQMLSGELPYSATNSWDLQNQIIYEAPATLPADVDAPPGIVAVLEKAQQKKPERRYGTIEEFVEAVANLSFSGGTKIKRRPRLPAKALLQIATVVLVAVLIWGIGRVIFHSLARPGSSLPTVVIVTREATPATTPEQSPTTAAPVAAATGTAGGGATVVRVVTTATSEISSTPTKNPTRQPIVPTLPPTPTLIPTPLRVQNKPTKPRTAAITLTLSSPTEASKTVGEWSIEPVTPSDGETNAKALTFSWKPDFELPENMLFELVFWKDGDSHEDGWGPVPASRKTSQLVHFDSGLNWLVPGTWHWGVYLFSQDYEKKRLRYLGGGWTFRIPKGED